MQGPSSTVHYPNPAAPGAGAGSAPGGPANPAVPSAGAASATGRPSDPLATTVPVGRDRSEDRWEGEGGSPDTQIAAVPADHQYPSNRHDAAERLRSSWTEMKTHLGDLIDKSDEQTRRRTREMLDSVDAQITQMNRSVQGAANRSREQLRRATERGRQQMQHATERGRQQMAYAARRSSAQLRRSAREVDRFAHENSWAVASAAAVVGALLGAYLTSRMNSEHSDRESWTHRDEGWSHHDYD